MKKGIVALLLFVCLFSLCSCAKEQSINSTAANPVEEFTLRNGIKFGMTTEELVQFEKEQGIELVQTASSNLIWPAIDRLEADFISIAGQEGSSLAYVLDNSKLSSCFYTYTSRMELLGCKSIGEDVVLASLKEKYGEPVAQGDSFIDIGKGYDALDMMYHLTKTDDYFGSGRITNSFYQWLCPSTNGTVDIMLITINSSNSLAKEYRIISYSLRTEAEMLIKEMKDEQKNTQLQNDL